MVLPSQHGAAETYIFQQILYMEATFFACNILETLATAMHEPGQIRA